MKNFFSSKGIEAQPHELYPLFFIELWERFGFYAVQTILVLYLTKVFHLSDTNAYDLFGMASAFIYATPFIGGYLADKILGYRKAIWLGGIILMIGYWLLMFPGIHMVYWALGCIVVGNGFFKSCIATLVGFLYKKEDPRQDAGFTIFYMGINIGSFLGPVMSGYVSEAFGWPFAFGLTGGGMVISLIIAAFTFKRLGVIGLPPKTEKINFLWWKIEPRYAIYIGSIIAIFFFGWLVKNHHLASIAFVAVCVACILGIFVLAFICEGQERSNMLVLIFLLIFSVIFWSIYNQTFSSLNLFTDRIVNRNFFGYEVPTAFFQSVNPFFIIVLTPFFAKLWPYVDSRKLWLTSGSAKFTLALFCMTGAYLVLMAGISLHADDGKVSMFWLNSGYFLQTIGELCLSPIGLSLVTQLAPERYRAMMMGGWLLTTSMGFLLGDYLSQFSSVPDELVHGSILNIEHFYTQAFSIFMVLAAVSGFALWMLTPLLNKMLRNDLPG